MSLVLLEKIRGVSARAQCLCSSEEVEKALNQVAMAVRADLEEADPIVLCVLIGGVVLTGKLLTLLNFPLQVDYIHATRYGDQIVGGKIEWISQPRISLKGRTVLLVDDILDHGVTLTAIVNFCRERGARDVKTAVLVEKQVARQGEVIQKADYTGVVVEDRYLFGYGMDYKGYLRNVSGIYAVAKEDEGL